MSRRNKMFWESGVLNNATYLQYYHRLTELAISMFEWKNLPDTIDPRYMELGLFAQGQMVFFEDDGGLGYLCLHNAQGGSLDVYGIPNNRQAYAPNGYTKNLTAEDSVLIFNNYLHTNSMLDIQMFARRLYNLDRSIDVNANAQKTPVLINCDESQRLTLLNVYKQWTGNEPIIMGTKDLGKSPLNVLNTGAPFVADKLYTLKTQLWNEALTYLGISNINIQKKERLITDEVTRNQGGTIASRYSRLESRREACKKINAMFGLNIWCDYREDFQAIDPETVDGDDTIDSGEEVTKE